MVTNYYDLITKTSSLFPLKTLPEKCVWGGVAKEILYCAVPATPNKGEYPDIWYQGIESFNDELWSINTTTGQTEIVADKETFSENGGVDATKLQLSPKEDYLSFINKKDLTLWLIKIK